MTIYIVRQRLQSSTLTIDTESAPFKTFAPQIRGQGS